MRDFQATVASGRRALYLSAALCAMLAPLAQASAQTVPVETITVNGQRDLDTASAVAPSETPLDAIQPTAVISGDFIQKTMPPSVNYDEAIKYSPSVFDVAPNGPGLAESQTLSIRGFQDGEFNVTFDGIPWGDSNDFTHHSTSYFMAHDLGQINIDYGPGTASTIGNATFGGTVSLLSKAPDDQMSFQPYMSYGSWNTQLYGGEADSGKLADYGGTRIMADAEGLHSDGYLSDMFQDRQNAFVKLIRPIGDSTTLTLVGMYNHIDQGISLGATQAQIGQFGPNFALSNNSQSQNYFGYNQDHIQSDFEYADLETAFGNGWSLDSKVYTYAYYHQGLNGEDPNGETPNGTSFGPNDVPGQLLQNDYRSIGTISRLTKDFDFGDVKTGVWYDRQINTRSLYEVDFSEGEAINPMANPATGGVDRLLHQTNQTLQPYLQVDIKPIDGLVLSPGVRYSWFDRNVDAQVNVKSGLAQSYDNTFSATLPSFSANYTIAPGWSAYAQVAEGFLAPNENFFNRTNPSSTNVSPQESWNYQVGTSFQKGAFSLSGDLYWIDFGNLIGSHTVDNEVTYFNQGGVTYKGIEGQGTYLLGGGFAVYAAGSLNSAKDKQSGQWIQNAPMATANGGLMYNEEGVNASLFVNWIGSRYGDVGQTQGLDPFYQLNLSGGYDLSQLSSALPKNTQIQLEVDNLTNNTKIFALAGYTGAASTPLYWTLPGRSAFMTLSTKF